jgi:hypothetical protein
VKKIPTLFRRTFDENHRKGILDEGIVFWRNGEPQCKIKRTDFGFTWPPKK